MYRSLGAIGLSLQTPLVRNVYTVTPAGLQAIKPRLGTMMDVWNDILLSFVNFLSPVSRMPYSALFVLVVGVLLAVISSLITVRMVDMGKFNANMEELRDWQKKLREARKSMDPVLLQEVLGEQSHIMQIQLSMQSARMKPCCVFYIPLLIIYAVLSTLYGTTPVAVLPFNPQNALPFLEPYFGVSVQGGFGLWFWTWYLLSAAGLGSIVRRAFGVPNV